MSSNSNLRIIVLAPNSLWLQKANILINQEGQACLADFGLITILPDSKNPTTQSPPINAGTIRWMSPELLDPEQFNLEDSQPTRQSDCYALGMVTLEVLSGQPPFASHRDLVVMRKVLDGKCPERPRGVVGEQFTNDLWNILEECWATQSQSRPSIKTVLKCFVQVSRAWTLPSQLVGKDMDGDGAGMDDGSVKDENSIKTGQFPPSLTLITSSNTPINTPIMSPEPISILNPEDDSFGLAFNYSPIPSQPSPQPSFQPSAQPSSQSSPQPSSQSSPRSSS